LDRAWCEAWALRGGHWRTGKQGGGGRCRRLALTHLGGFGDTCQAAGFEESTPNRKAA